MKTAAWRYERGLLVEYTVNGVSRPLDETFRIVNGPGMELKKLLSKFGFKPKAGCKCAQHIREMDLKGLQWCRDNIDTIVGWLREEAQRAGYPFTAIGAKILIRRAIRNAS